MKKRSGVSWRFRLTALAVGTVALAGGYWFWFRDSEFVRVTEVEVRGATVNQRAIARALDRTGAQMTTLHIRQSELLETLGRFPTVAAVSARAEFPHTLIVTIRERPPVAVTVLEGKRTGVSADGYALIGLDVSRFELPSIDASLEQGGRVDDRGREQAEILGATPGPLKPGLVSAAWVDSLGGVVVDLRNAPELRFGDGAEARRKWAAAAAILSDPALGSPAYVDVSAPGRPVAG